MLVCSSCGAENREGARFCDSCGAALAEAAAPREVRKVVTVLFCDVTGSTALGERIDPESLRRVMARYFETAKAIVERHGGTVEKFIGDAVMAVFGVPAVHEDDALRAVRAADELRGGLGDLNEELEASYGTRLELRIGVNTGEVVTGTEERLATGDAVNVAARLEQAADPGVILLGEETCRLVRDSVDCEPTEPIRAKGKSEPLRAYRLLSVSEETPTRTHDAPMVGRERQRKLLEDAFAAVSAERSCHLFTILGAAGVGKSRLASEFLGALDGATVVSGRCLSYGEGISYWPVTGVVKQLAPTDAETVGLAPILGDESATSSPQELAWSFRKLLESRAAERPLVVVFDDVHWGEPAFLDLVEHVADLSRGAPILLLCMARAELLDQRPAWGGGKLNVTNLLLEPLAQDEAGKLIEALADGIPEAQRERILEAAGGNPLFVEEMVAMAVEEGVEIIVPPTIQALLAARLDQLDPAERGVLECGAVEGLVFHRGAVAALTPDEPQVEGRLVTLVRKDLVRPDEPVFADDEAYRFRHLLIRDTAYDALPKAVRAELHERFASWLQEHGADLIELDEIAGYHLEQAYRYRVELGPLDAAAAAIGEGAGQHLARSADRARHRGDVEAAVPLLARTVELLPESHPDRRAAQAHYAQLLAEVGRYDDAEQMRADAEAGAREAGDEALLARLVLAGLEAEVQSKPGTTIRDALAGAEKAHAELERLGDEHGAVWALRLIGNFQGWLGHSRQSEQTLRHALERANRLNGRLGDEIRLWLLWEAWSGPVSTDDGLRRCEEYLEGARRSGSMLIEATALNIGAVLKAYRGDFEAARADVGAGRAQLFDLGGPIWSSGPAMIQGEIELAAGNPRAAYDVLAEGHRVLGGIAKTGYLATIVGYQAEAALELGREAEALELSDEVERLAQKDDFEPRARARLVRALVEARRGALADAEGLLREAAGLIELTDYLFLHVRLNLVRAEVAGLAGKSEDEREALEKALAAAEEKGCLVAARGIRERLAQL
ncbi:MAG TPA: adenylate/guanylate cyclase domain-containing protein [Gaiellaceae bacterium]|nr:adenylate/guanylate cyclase domain-containing protein [Gaiellaceae bacterium]